MPLPLLVALAFSQGVPAESPAQHAARMNWWREARFGMFIHWGLYAVPAGKWGNDTGHGEWIRETARIPVGEYEKLQPQFNPTRFDADAWARLAKAAGMKYLVLTSKHHDGFALFDSKVTTWDVMNTPFRRDIVRELAQACRRHGIKLGLYHSIMDWHHPDYLPRRGWEAAQRPAAGADFDRFFAYLKAQVTEILTNYGDVAVVWFDGEWENTWNDRYGRELYALCRRLQPNTIVNNRVANNRGGSMHDEGKIRIGDYATPEQYIPTEGLAGVDWESCMTMNNNWGYNAADQNWKSSQTLVRNLIDTASKGGNYLLNIGPKADGTFPQPSVDRLAEIGAWMRVNGDSIYGTKPSPFKSLPWGRATQKGNRLYLHVFIWPQGGQLLVPGLASTVRSASILERRGTVRTVRRDANVIVEVPRVAPNGLATVVALELEGAPVVYAPAEMDAPGLEFVSSTTVRFRGDKGIDWRYTDDGTPPTPSSAPMPSQATFTRDATLMVTGFKDGKPVAPTRLMPLRKVSPWSATTIVAPKPGLRLREYAGEWDRLPNFELLTPTREAVVDGISAAEAENVGRRFDGYVFVPEDDVYEFALRSDDGGRLKIDGKMVVDHDGLHAADVKIGRAPLAKGWHAVEVVWFNRSGGRALGLQMAPSGRKPAAIPPEFFAHP